MRRSLNKPSLPMAVTIGDPGGIGPELVARLWRKFRKGKQRFIAFGAAQALLDRDLPVQVLARWHQNDLTTASAVFAERLTVVSTEAPVAFSPGVYCPSVAPAVVAGIRDAVAAVRSGCCQGLVTGPITKAALRSESGVGHTEFLGSLCQSDFTLLLMVAKGMRVMPLTLHVPYYAVALDRVQLKKALELLLSSLTDLFRVDQPRVLVTGLNPHAGEQGRLGDQEQRIIAPVISELIEKGNAIVGPVAADAAFIPQTRKNFDAIVTMTHDQALIPIKALAFSSAVNVTLGLPMIRTSPGHGVAYDIVDQPDRIDERPFVSAYRLAVDLAKKQARKSGDY